MTTIASLCRRRAACIALMLGIATSPGFSPAHAAGLQPEFSLGYKGLLPFGDLATVTGWGYGGDAAFSMVRDGGGLGVRAAAGLEILEGHTINTGEPNFAPYGGGEGKFEASQSMWWVAIGPAWSRPAKSGRVDFYLMAGKARVNASNSGGWINMAGTAPGASRVWLGVLGTSWSPGNGRIELGAELHAGGSAAFWDDPPALEDSAGNHVLQSKSAAITGIMLRVGRRFGSYSGQKKR